MLAGTIWASVLTAERRDNGRCFQPDRPACPALGGTIAPVHQVTRDPALLPGQQAGPDLRPQISGPAQGHAGQDISAAIKLSVTNMGNAIAAAGFLIEIGLLMAPEKEPAMYHALVQLASPYPLAPHESREYRVAGAVIPENFQWGTNRYRLCARIAPANHPSAAARSMQMACTEIDVVPEREGD